MTTKEEKPGKFGSVYSQNHKRIQTLIEVSCSRDLSLLILYLVYSYLKRLSSPSSRSSRRHPLYGHSEKEIPKPEIGTYHPLHEKGSHKFPNLKMR